MNNPLCTHLIYPDVKLTTAYQTVSILMICKDNTYTLTNLTPFISYFLLRDLASLSTPILNVLFSSEIHSRSEGFYRYHHASKMLRLQCVCDKSHFVSIHSHFRVDLCALYLFMINDFMVDILVYIFTRLENRFEILKANRIGRLERWWNFKRHTFKSP